MSGRRGGGNVALISVRGGARRNRSEGRNDETDAVKIYILSEGQDRLRDACTASRRFLM